LEKCYYNIIEFTFIKKKKYFSRCTLSFASDGEGLIFSEESIKMNEISVSSKETLLVLKSVNGRNHSREPESYFKNIPLRCGKLELKMFE
jgi:hypothetical protein